MTTLSLPRRPTASGPVGSDRVFRSVLRSSGATVLLVMSLVGVFLGYRAVQALQVAGLSFLSTANWQPDAGHGRFGIAAVFVGTVLIGLVAITVALPLAIGAALYISEYAPRSLRRTIISLVDLMAAVPSVVYGLWGFFFLQGHILGLARWISTYFASQAGGSTGTSGGSSGVTTGSSTSLPRTGANTWITALWALFLLWAGIMVVLYVGPARGVGRHAVGLARGRNHASRD